MCGITGIMNLDIEKKTDYSVIKKMTDIISYRGPDGEGFYLHNNLALGHRRLSIIDLRTGDQPMFSQDKKIVIVFNGEIYNYIELREELIKSGHKFYTDSDTEVVINSYKQWGIECQSKFNGMWAFALWDEKNQRLLLSRDRIGEKPLHYSIFENTLVFGSEIKSLLAYGIPKDPDLEFLEIYLSLGYIPAPYTFYKNINKLKAGHYLVSTNGKISVTQYWNLPEIDEKKMHVGKNEVNDKFKYLLKDSVKLRMRSDVPYGAFLSGGLDSSSIVSLMAEISSFPVETFTIGYKEKSFDERHLAVQVADKFKTNHNEYVVEPDTFDESLKNVVYHYDEPFGDSSAIPTGYVSKYASSKVKMVLTGDGGDEVLSGYTKYQGEKFAGHYQRFPGWARKTIPRSISVISKPFRGSLRYKLNRMEDVCLAANLNFVDRYLAKALWIEESYITQLVKGLKVYPIMDLLTDLEKECNYTDPFYKLMYFQHKLSLPNDMLVKVDRMSMAYSLESRTPFLDHRLIEYMANVHKDNKMHIYERKTILRNTIGHTLPKQLLSAPKRGFVVPVREWFRGNSFNERFNELEMTMPFLNKEVISNIVQAHQSGQRDYGNFIWMLFILQKSMVNGG